MRSRSLAVLVVILFVAGSAWPQLVRGVEAVEMTVQDMDRSVDFYSKVLAFEKLSDVEVAGEDYERLTGVFGARIRQVRMKLGNEQIVLSEFLAPKGKPFPTDSKSNDRDFQHIAIIVSDMDEAYAHLRENKVLHASTGPQTLPDWNKNAGGIKAFYFRDPDGHYLEILSFPPGKGQARWQSKDRLFLGIDHTAIVVSDTDASLRFYRDLLGLKVAGESENYGTEQEHLNNVFGAKLHITALRGDLGPGIEFLEYLTPRDGRPVPFDQRANDIASWRTHLVAMSADATLDAVRRAKIALASPGVMDVSFGSNHIRGLLVKDPDGHTLELVEHH